MVEIIRLFFFLIDKIENKLENWNGQLLSIVGRLISINKVQLQSPLYVLSMYKIPVKIHKQADRIRNKFLWQETSTNGKWEEIFSKILKNNMHGKIIWRYGCPEHTTNGYGING